MIPRSIKWRLQLWYGLILVAVLAGFGATAYRLEQGRQFRRVDEELHRRFAAITDALHQGHPPRRGEHPPLFGPLAADELPGNPPPHNFAPAPFAIPPFVAGLFDTNLPDHFYFVINARDGKQIASSGRRPAVMASQDEPPAVLPESLPSSAPDRPNAKPPQMFTRDDFSEIFSRLPGGETVIVGCSIAPERHELKIAALNLTTIGALILLVGLAGGWWLVERALRPISEIGSTAARISAGDLARRIDIAEAESELGQLAAVLNSTFARLETAFAQQKQFAADAAHELRTPVSVLLTQTQTALSRERDAAGYKQTVEACQRAAQRMRRLIESLLELTRFDAGQEILQRIKFDLAGAVAESVELVQPLANERQVKIFNDTRPLEITGDPARLAQVVINLLTNAIQFNQPDGQVRLTLGTQDGLAVLEISDTGRGIAPDDLPHVFERFYRADKSRTGAGNTGLGLAICKAIVEAHGGTVEVSSVPKAGTKFVVRLPV